MLKQQWSSSDKQHDRDSITEIIYNVEIFLLQKTKDIKILNANVFRFEYIECIDVLHWEARNRISIAYRGACLCLFLSIDPYHIPSPRLRRLRAEWQSQRQL